MKATTPKKVPSYSAPALEKGLLILEKISTSSVPLSLAELAPLLKKSRHELFRMLNCLEAMGYLRREEISGKYGLTFKLFELTRNHNPIEKIKEAARIPLQKLTEKIRESVHLSLISDGLLNVFFQLESPEKIRLNCETGSSFDPLQTSSGKVLLSRLKPEQRTYSLEKSKIWNAASALQKGRILSNLDGISQKNIYVQSSDLIEGIEDRILLIESPHSELRVALAVCRFRQRLGATPVKFIDQALLIAQNEIQKNLGIDIIRPN